MRLRSLLKLDMVQLSKFLSGLSRNQLESVTFILWEVLRVYSEHVEPLPLDFGADLLEGGQGKFMEDVTYMDDLTTRSCSCGATSLISANLMGNNMCGACYTRLPRTKQGFRDKERFEKEWRKTTWGRAWEDYALCRCDEPQLSGKDEDPFCVICSKWVYQETT